MSYSLFISRDYWRMAHCLAVFILCSLGKKSAVRVSTCGWRDGKLFSLYHKKWNHTASGVFKCENEKLKGFFKVKNLASISRMATTLLAPLFVSFFVARTTHLHFWTTAFKHSKWTTCITCKRPNDEFLSFLHRMTATNCADYFIQLFAIVIKFTS